MRLLYSRNLIVAAAAAVALLSAWSAPAPAQPIDPGNGGGGFGGGPVGGVQVDAQGVLTARFMRDLSGTLKRQQYAARRAELGGELTAKSDFRSISLQKLERSIKKRLDNNAPLTDDMLYLAGLTRIRYVFYYPGTKDIVIAGPAEGFITDPSGRMIGMNSGRAILRLEDLVVALRSFAPSSRAAPVISCSIDPTKEGLARMQQTVIRFQRQLRARPNAQQTQQLVGALRDALGLQTVTVKGVSPKTHFAQVLVEADYRMKLIGIGLEKPVVRVTSYVSMANPSAVARNALKRWYFVPDYECVRVSDDDLAMELVGEGVKLVGENELVSADGSRQTTRSGDRASQMFVTSFTAKYPELARRSPVWGELRNVIDLSVAAAYIQNQGYYQKSGWDLGVFADEEAFAVRKYNAPKQVPSACTAVWKGSRLMTPIGGGVHIQPRQALSSQNLLEDEGGKVEKLRTDVDLAKFGQGKWWHD